MSFEISSKKKIDIIINGQAYSLSKLSVGKMREMGDSSIFEKMKQFNEDPLGALLAGAEMLVAMGLPREVVETLDSDEIGQIMEFVSGASKKN